MNRSSGSSIACGVVLITGLGAGTGEEETVGAAFNGVAAESDSARGYLSVHR